MNPRCSLTALANVGTEAPTRIETTIRHPTLPPRPGPSSALDTEHSLVFAGMRALETYQLEFVFFDEAGQVAGTATQDFTTGALPLMTPPNVVMSTMEADDGVLTLFGAAPKTLSTPGEILDEPLVVAVDRSGEVVWYLENPGIQAVFAPRDLWMRDDGTFMALTPGGALVADLAGEVVQKIRSPDPDIYFHHDIIDLPQGGFATLGGVRRYAEVPQLGGEVLLREDQIIELDEDGEIVWQWSTFEHLDTTRFPGPLSLNPLSGSGLEPLYDWTHANAVQYLPSDNTYLISLRHQNWVLKVSRETGEVVWRLGPEGDFELLDGEEAPAQWFYNQHNPGVYEDGVLTLYDNGNERPGTDERYTRVVSYALDETAMTATQVWSSVTPNYMSFLGGVEPSATGDWLIAAGGNRDEAVPAEIYEVAANAPQTPTWGLSYPTAVIYRAHQVPSLYVDAP